MIKKLLLILFLVTTSVSYVNAAKDNNQTNLKDGGKTVMNDTTLKDYEAVKNILNKYLEAGRAGKSSVLRPYVHENALMYGRTNSELSGGSIEALFTYLDTNPAAKEMKAEITSIDIAEGIAYGKVESDNWNGARFTDMFLLVKDGNDWKILTKTFFTH